MNVEILKLQNKLAEAKRRFKDLDIRVSGLIILVRGYLDPYEDDVTLLETQKAQVEISNLHSAVEEMKELSVKIQKLQKDLGHE